MNQEAVRYLEGDPVMSQLMGRIGVIKMQPRRLPPCHSLIHAIIHQQLSGKAAGTILSRFQALFGDGEFPEPAAVADADLNRLRSAGLSRAKASYVKDVAQKVIDGVIPSLEECERMRDEELMERFTSIKGVAGGQSRCF